MIENILDSVSNEEKKFDRGKLLPWWIKAFSWIFLIFGCLVPVVLILPLFGLENIRISILGLKSNSPYDAQGMIAVLFFALSGMASYGLLWKKKWGVLAGIIIGFVGLFLLFGNIFVNGYQQFPIEWIFQLPFLVKLFRIKDSWEQN